MHLYALHNSTHHLLISFTFLFGRNLHLLKLNVSVLYSPLPLILGISFTIYTVNTPDVYRILQFLNYTGCPKKMSPVIFGGITSLYLIKGSIFLQWVEKQSYYGDIFFGTPCSEYLLC